MNLVMTCCQSSLSLEDPIFGALAFGDVDVAADIADETAIAPEPRDPRGQEPSVFAVGVAQSILEDEWPPRFERRHVGGQAPVEIVWMDEVQPAVLAQLFERPAGQLFAEAVEIIQ